MRSCRKYTSSRSGHDGLEALLRACLAVDVDQRLAADQPRRQHRVARLVVGQRRLARPACSTRARAWRRSPRAARRSSAPRRCEMIAMRGHRSATSSTMCVERITTTCSPISASRLRKRLRSSGIEAGGRLVDDHQPRIAEQRLRDAEALAHAAGERAELALAHVPQIDLLQQCLDRLRRARLRCT